MRSQRYVVTLALFVTLAAGVRAQAPIRASVFVSGLTAPVAFVQDPSNVRVQYVVEQAGRIRVVLNGALQATAFLDLRGAAIAAGGERGLLGLAFPPDYAASGRFYVNFTNPAGHTVVARYRRSATPLVADAASRFDLLLGPAREGFILQPYANHNGGNLAFGPDGYLYIGMGDGGDGNDPQHRAQNPVELLGKMLRIDVSVADGNANGYQVPPTNPFVSGGPAGTRPEIWSFGLRNPWRFSFDPPALGGTGALVIGDVGQGAWEEVDYEPAGRGGRNYGWRNREGAHDNVVSKPAAFLPLTDPIHEYDHATGQSITGGIVYRGSALGSGARGRYFFADYVQGRVWSIGLTIDSSGNAVASPRVDHTAELGGSAILGNISAFGVDADGEMYIVNHTGGTVVKVLGLSLIPAAPTGLRIIRSN
jgi:glucose/arabinose dehydrogenase